jgi:hypothetical protein
MRTTTIQITPAQGESLREAVGRAYARWHPHQQSAYAPHVYRVTRDGETFYTDADWPGREGRPAIGRIVTVDGRAVLDPLPALRRRERDALAAAAARVAELETEAGR